MYVKTQDSRLKTQDSRLKRIAIATLLAVSTLNGVAFAAGTEKEKQLEAKLKKVEVELQQYKEISAKYNTELKTSHETYTEYKKQIDHEYLQLQNKLKNIQQPAVNINVPDNAEMLKEVKEIDEDLDAISSNISDSINKQKQLTQQYKVDSNKAKTEYEKEIKALKEENKNALESIVTHSKQEEALKKLILEQQKKHEEELKDAENKIKAKQNALFDEHNQNFQKIHDSIKLELNRLNTRVNEKDKQLKQELDKVHQKTNRLKAFKY